MNRWLQRFLVFLTITGLIVGGLGWATSEALRMEENQRQVEGQKERAEKLRRALWRLDGTVSTLLARENSRPFAHFSPLYAPVPAMTWQGVPSAPGSVRVPSPLMETELPPWMLLHFQFTPEGKADHRWQSPQVLPIAVRDWLGKNPFNLTLVNVTPQRQELLMSLQHKYPGDQLLAEVRKRAPQTTSSEPVAEPKNDLNNSIQVAANSPATQAPNRPESQSQTGNSQRGRSYADTDQKFRQDATNASKTAPRGSKEVDPSNLESITMPKSMTCDTGDVQMTSMTAMWFPSPEQPDYLMYVRLARFGQKDIVQGVIINWPLLREELRTHVLDLFSEAKLTPLPDGADADAEGAMSALPVLVDPGPAVELPPAGWTPLRIGLGVAWAAVLLALLAMGFSGLSLIDLSERRIRFVSAVTHELRTPLTTLRLYLDMLTSGLIRDESKKDEYLRTLNGESERLHRLISNVLDFARLEKQSARPALTDIPAADVIAQVRASWAGRCEAAGKELVVADAGPSGVKVHADSVLVQQILGNLIDNACKYSKCAADRRVWLRVMPAGERLAFEVEDCGPGIVRREWRSIFRPFRRGHGADTTAGGVGLGLALARRWAGMLGGRLELRRGENGPGACFRLELPRA